jgi:hypothetical protein
MIRNPVYILGLFLAFVLSYAAWLQYDITAYFRHGSVRTYSPLSQNSDPVIPLIGPNRSCFYQAFLISFSLYTARILSLLPSASFYLCQRWPRLIPVAMMPFAGVRTSHYFVKSSPHCHGDRDGDSQHEPQQEAFFASVSPSRATPCSKLQEPDAETRSSALSYFSRLGVLILLG